MDTYYDMIGQHLFSVRNNLSAFSKAAARGIHLISIQKVAIALRGGENFCPKLAF